MGIDEGLFALFSHEVVLLGDLLGGEMLGGLGAFEWFGWEGEGLFGIGVVLFGNSVHFLSIRNI